MLPGVEDRDNGNVALKQALDCKEAGMEQEARGHFSRAADYYLRAARAMESVPEMRDDAEHMRLILSQVLDAMEGGKRTREGGSPAPPRPPPVAPRYPPGAPSGVPSAPPPSPSPRDRRNGGLAAAAGRGEGAGGARALTEDEKNVLRRTSIINGEYENIER